MTDEGVAPAPASAQTLAGLRQITLILYVLYAVAPLTAGLSALLAVVINHFKRDEVRGTLYESHFLWQVELFWWTVLWLVLGYLTVWLYYTGLAVFLAGLVWYVYRLVKGFSYLNNGKPLPTRIPSAST
jgi:uncharacterized membrane protein